MSSQDKLFKKAADFLSNSDVVVDFNEAAQDLLFSGLSRYADNFKKLNPKGYNTFTALEDADPSILLSKITSHGPGVQPFVEYGGHPVLASARTPNFKLIKLFRDSNNKVIEGMNVEIPLFLYGTQTILNPTDRSTEAFFSSINFDLKNTTPFAAGRLVEVNLEIGFNSLAAMSKTYSVLTDKGTPKQFQYLDLVRRSAGRSPDPQSYASYSLQLQIGWNPVDTSMFKGGEEASVLSAASGAGTAFNNITLFLELTDYDIDIQQNGMVKLNLNYHSFIERQLDTVDYDLFNGTAEFSPNVKGLPATPAEVRLRRLESTLKSHRDKLIRIKAGIEKLGGYSQGSRWASDEERAKTHQKNVEIYEEWVAENEKAMGDRLIDLRQEARAEKESRKEAIEARLIFQNKVGKYQKIMSNILRNKRIFSVEIPRDQLMMYSPEYSKAYKAVGGKDVSDKVLKAEVAAKKLEAAKNTSFNETTNQNLNGQEVGTKINDAAKDMIVNEANKDPKFRLSAEQEKQAFANGLQKYLDKAFNADANKGESVLVHFFSFGTLMDACLQLYGIDNKMVEDKIGIVLGNVSYLDIKDPATLLQSMSETEIMASLEQKSINIADLPISVEYFSQFFAATIIDKGMERLPLFGFLKAVINQLLIPALNRAIGGFTTLNPIKINTANVESINPIVGTSLATGDVQNWLFPNTRLQMNHPETAKGVQKILKSSSVKDIDPNLVWNYIFVFGSQSKMLSGVGSYDKDMQNGVYHFTFGDASSPSGGAGGRTDLIKDIKFTKVKKPGQREMMVERQMSGGGVDPYIELWNIFDVSITMVGNNLLRPGKHIHITPAVSGFGSPGGERTISSELGLGGYYLVTSVSNTFEGSSGEWTTQVQAAWQSSSGIYRSQGAGQQITPEDQASIEAGGASTSGGAYQTMAETP